MMFPAFAACGESGKASDGESSFVASDVSDSSDLSDSSDSESTESTESNGTWTEVRRRPD